MNEKPITRRQARFLVRRANRMCGESDFRELLAEVWSAAFCEAGAIEHEGRNPFLPAVRAKRVSRPSQGSKP